METKTLNIYQKLSRISNDLSVVAKNLEVGVGQVSYKAVGEADVLKAIKPLEEKYGVYSYPIHRTILESGILENETIDRKTQEHIIKKNLYERIETTYRFVNMDNPSEYIDIVSYGDGIDSQDKSVGKAMTYADKYALMKAYKIITGDDPDQEPSGELKSAKVNNKEIEALKLKATELGVNLTKLAQYRKRESVDGLTKDDLEFAINQYSNNERLAK